MNQGENRQYCANCDLKKACLRHVERDVRYCIDCARKHESDSDEAVIRNWRPFISVLGDKLVVLREKPRPGKGRIIIPTICYDDKGRLKGTTSNTGFSSGTSVQSSVGRVVALGPGRLQRVRMGEPTWRDVIEPMPAVAVGQRIAFRDKFEEATYDWRGLTIVYAHDILGGIEQEDVAAE